MPRCRTCHSRLKTQRRDIERVVLDDHHQPHRLRVMDMYVHVCTGCGAIRLKRWITEDSLQRMLRARLQHEWFVAIRWDDLISNDFHRPAR